MANPQIHSTAIIEKGVELADDVVIGPYSIVGEGARIGRNTRLMSHVVIDGLTHIGEDNVFHPFCVIGGPPQDLTYQNEPTKVVIGDRNVFRESCTVHRGTLKDKGVTTIGNDNFVMAFCHFAHDNTIGNHLIMANQTSLAGHVTVGDYVVLGGQAAVTQHCRVGDYGFIGAGSILRRDLPPYMCAKEFSQVSGPNLVGLKRRNLSKEDVRVICELYKLMYLSNQTTEKALVAIEERFADNEYSKRFVDFVRKTKVGIQR